MTDKRKKLDELIEKIGMKHELQPLLDSCGNDEDSYARFEKAVESVLRRYNFSESWIPGGSSVREQGRNGYRRTPMYISFGSDRPFAIPHFDKSLCMFKQFYGISCESKEIDEIAKENMDKLYVENVRMKINDLRIHADKYSRWRDCDLAEIKELEESLDKPAGFRKKECFKMIDKIILMLKHKHKRDIWYGSL